MLLRRLEKDKKFLSELIDKRIVEGDNIIYTISKNSGSGSMKSFIVMSGVEIIYNDFNLTRPIQNMLNINVDCLEITYCLKGQVEVKMLNEKYSYMTDEDISLFGYQTKAVSCDFSLKPFVGITIMIYLKDFIKNLNSMFSTEEFHEEEFFEQVFTSDRCIISHANKCINHIFKELYVLPDRHKNYLMKIKIIELLFYLMDNIDYKENDTIYFSKTSVDKIKEARQIILNRIDKHITVKQLSKMVEMNSTDLEKGFKSIYGSTIFSYGKICKMKKAKEFLSDEKMPILEIALSCGYSNGGKFAKAFKDTFGMLPTEYRKSIIKKAISI